MITLFGGGPNFGLPETSPYVTKTEVQLKIAGLAYRKERATPQQSPKGQVPFIDDGGVLIADEIDQAVGARAKLRFVLAVERIGFRHGTFDGDDRHEHVAVGRNRDRDRSPALAAGGGPRLRLPVEHDVRTHQRLRHGVLRPLSD